MPHEPYTRLSDGCCIVPSGTGVGCAVRRNCTAASNSGEQLDPILCRAKSLPRCTSSLRCAGGGSKLIRRVCPHSPHPQSWSPLARSSSRTNTCSLVYSGKVTIIIPFFFFPNTQTPNTAALFPAVLGVSQNERLINQSSVENFLAQCRSRQAAQQNNYIGSSIVLFS